MKSRSVRKTHDKYLRDPEFAAEYLNEFLQDGDMAEILLAMRNIVQAQEGGFSAIAESTTRTRSSLYKTLSENGNPQFANILSLARSVGLTLKVEPTRKSA